MDGPRRRAVATLTAALIGVGVFAQEPSIPATGSGIPKVMPPRSGPPVTVTVSPFGDSPLPPTGVPLGTPIPGSIPPGTQIKSIPGPITTPIPVESSAPTGSFFSPSPTPAPLPVPAAPSPYFGYYPTQWRTFPDQPYPACPTPGSPAAPGSLLPTYPANMTPPSETPPLLKVTPPANTPNPLPMTVEAPSKGNVVPSGGFPTDLPKSLTLPPLLPSEEPRGPVIPGLVPTAGNSPAAMTPVYDTGVTLARMGRPRLRSAPDPVLAPPVPAPAVLPALVAPPVLSGPDLPPPISGKAPVIPASAIEIPFLPAPEKPTPIETSFGAEQSAPVVPLRVRPPMPPHRPKFSEDSTIRPAAPVIRAGGSGN